MNNWLYKKREICTINDMPQETYGFIYLTVHTPTGKQYLGKKSLYHNVKKKLTKKELAEQTGPGRKPTTVTVKKESDWKTYYGSEEFIKQRIKEGKHDEFTREILQLVYSKKLLTYYECKYQFMFNVLESDKWLNTNILGKFFSKDFASE